MYSVEWNPVATEFCVVYGCILYYTHTHTYSIAYVLEVNEDVIRVMQELFLDFTYTSSLHFQLQYYECELVYAVLRW